MNIWDILILAAVAAALFFAFRAASGNRKNCCGGCRGCRKNDRACPSCRSEKQENAHEKTP